MSKVSPLLIRSIAEYFHLLKASYGLKTVIINEIRSKISDLAIIWQHSRQQRGQNWEWVFCGFSCLYPQRFLPSLRHRNVHLYFPVVGTQVPTCSGKVTFYPEVYRRGLCSVSDLSGKGFLGYISSNYPHLPLGKLHYKIHILWRGITWYIIRLYRLNAQHVIVFWLIGLINCIIDYFVG